MNVKAEGSANIVSVDVGVSGTPYAVGDVIGTAGGSGNDNGKLPFRAALKNSQRAGVLQSVTLYDYCNQKAAMDLLLFAQKPEGQYPDNAPIYGALAETNLGVLLGIVKIAQTDWKTVPGSVNNVAMAAPTFQPIVVRSNDTSGTIYGVLISGGTPTWYGSGMNLQLSLGFLL